MEETTDLTNFIIWWCCIEYTSPWTGFELTTLVVIGTDCTGSCKSNYHTITTTRVHEKNVVLYEIHRENWNGVNTFVHCPVQRGTTFLTGLTVDVRISVLSIPWIGNSNVTVWLDFWPLTLKMFMTVQYTISNMRSQQMLQHWFLYIIMVHNNNLQHSIPRLVKPSLLQEKICLSRWLFSLEGDNLVD